MSSKQKKKLKLETKLLGYVLIINSIIWINILWYQYIMKGDINACTDITKFILGAGIILLLGRKAISEIIIKLVEVFAKK